MYAAIVAVATTKIAPVRKPSTISGMAAGTSTLRICCQGVMPMPRAASLSSGSTPATPS